MDDWSTIPNRNAVSEPAPNHQSTLNQHPDRPARPQPAASSAHHPAPINPAAANPSTRPRPATQHDRGKAPKPLYPPKSDHDHHQPAPNVKNGQPPLTSPAPSWMTNSPHISVATPPRGPATASCSCSDSDLNGRRASHRVSRNMWKGERMLPMSCQCGGLSVGLTGERWAREYCPRCRAQAGGSIRICVPGGWDAAHPPGQRARPGRPAPHND